MRLQNSCLVFLIVAWLAGPGWGQGQNPKCFSDPECAAHGANAPTFDAGFGRAFNTLVRHTNDEPYYATEVGLADPVFPANLEFRLQRVDLKVEALGLDVVHERTWRSMNDYDGPLGRGFDFRLNERVIAEAGNNGKIEKIQLLDGSGRSDVFYRWDLLPNPDPATPLHFTLPASPVSLRATYQTPPVFQAPTSADLSNPKQVFYPPEDSSLTEMFEVQGGILTRFAPGRLRAEYELVLRPDQIDAGNNPQAFNDLVNTLYPGVHAAVPQVHSNLQIQPVNSNERYYRIKRYTDNFGNTITFHYASHHPNGLPMVTDELLRVTDSQGRDLSISYITQPGVNEGRIQAVTDFDGRTVAYIYDANGNLITVRDLAGEAGERITRYTYEEPQAGLFLLATVEQPTEAADPQVRKPTLRNRYQGRRVIMQEVGQAAVTPSMQGDPGNPGEPAYRFIYTAYQNGGTVDPQGIPAIPMLHTLQFFDRSGLFREFDFDTRGEITRSRLFQNGQSFETKFTWLNGRMVSREAPRADPTNSAHRGKLETWTYNSGSADPRNRGELLQRMLYPEISDDPSTSEVVHIWTYSDYHPVWQVAGHETGLDGIAMTRTFTTLGSRTAPTGFQIATTVSGGGLSRTTISERDARGRLIKVTDPLGGETHISYVAGTNLVATKVVNPSAASITLASNIYDLRGNLIQETDSTGAVTSHQYDRYDRLVATTYPGPEGYVETNEYDGNGRLVRHVIPVLGAGQGLVREFVRDIEGRVIQERVDRTGNGDWLTTHREYGPEGRIYRVTSASGIITEYQWSGRALLLHRTVGVGTPSAATWSYQYDHGGRLIRTTDPLGRIFDRTYDRHGRLKETIDPLGVIRASERTGTRVTRSTVTGPNGILYRDRRTSFDGLDRPIQVNVLAKRYPGGPDIGDGFQTTLSTFDVAGRLAGVQDERGFQSTITRDVLGRVLTATDPNGNLMTFSYLGATNKAVTKTKHEVRTAGFGSQTSTKVYSYSYDALGRRIAELDPLGTQTSFVYDFAGRVLSAIDGAGNRSVTSYDRLGNILHTALLSPDGSTVLSSSTRGYDSAGRLVSITDGAGQTTTFTYDVLGRIVSRHLADGSVETWSYDVLGRVTQKVDLRGSMFVFHYDAGDRLVRVVRTPGSNVVGDSADIVRTFDAIGQTLTISDGDSIIQYPYNTLGAVESESETVGQAPPRVFLSTYDAAGIRQGVDYPQIGGISYALDFQFDASGRLTALDDELGGVSSQLVSYGYEGRRRLIQANLGNGITEQVVYDGRGLLKNVSYVATGGSGATMLSSAIERDVLGRVTWRRVQYGNTTGVFHDDVQSFSYDGAGRLDHRFIGVTQPAWSQVTASTLPQVFSDDLNYDWSLVGTRQQVAHSTGQLDSFGYNLTNDMVIAAVASGTHTMSVDLAGNRTAETFGAEVASYHYDINNRLAEVYFSDGTQLVRRHDPLGRTIQESVLGPAGQTDVHRWYYDGASRTVEVTVADCVDGVQESLAAIHVFSVEGAAPLLSRYFSQGVGTGSFWSLTDASGWVRSVVDDAGTLVQHYIYTNEFGLVEGHQGANSQATPLAQLPTSWVWVWKGLRLLGGRPLHGKTLYESGARIFDSETASYLQRNPYNPTTTKGDTPKSDLSSVEGTLSPFNGIGGPDHPLRYPGPSGGGGSSSSGGGSGAEPRGGTDQGGHLGGGPVGPVKPGGPGAPVVAYDHRLPGPPGGTSPGGSTSSGGDPRGPDPRHDYVHTRAHSGTRAVPAPGQSPPSKEEIIKAGRAILDEFGPYWYSGRIWYDPSTGDVWASALGLDAGYSGPLLSASMSRGDTVYYLRTEEGPSQLTVYLVDGLEITVGIVAVVFSGPIGWTAAASLAVADVVQFVDNPTVGNGVVAALSLVPIAGKVGKLAAEGSKAAEVASEAATELGDSARGGSKTAAEMADDLAGQLGRNRVSGRTAGGKQIDIDLRGKGHFDKATGQRIETPHVHEATINVGPNGKINLSDKITRPATKQDIRTARRLAGR